MRVFACISAISLALAGPAATAAPGRVASLNLCTDELLLALAAPGQIVSVTHLAQQPGETPLWRQARQYKKNDGTLLSIGGLRPGLVLTMGGGARDRVEIARRLGIRAVDLPYPASLPDIESGIRVVAASLGRPAAGQAIIAKIRALGLTAPQHGVDSLWLGGGGRSVPAGGLAAQWMRLAGLSQRAVPGDRISLEQLLRAPPAILLRSDYRSHQYSGEQRWLAHPLANRATRSRSLRTDGRLWTCMGPLMIGEVLRLRAELRR